MVIMSVIWNESVHEKSIQHIQFIIIDFFLLLLLLLKVHVGMPLFGIPTLLLLYLLLHFPSAPAHTQSHSNHHSFCSIIQKQTKPLINPLKQRWFLTLNHIYKAAMCKQQSGKPREKIQFVFTTAHSNCSVRALEKYQNNKIFGDKYLQSISPLFPRSGAVYFFLA